MEQLRDILFGFDLTTCSLSAIFAAFESTYGKPLTDDQKEMIRANIDAILLGDQNILETRNEGNNSQTIKNFEEQDVQKQAPKCHERFMLRKLSEPLKEILGIEQASLFDVISGIWDYAKSNDLLRKEKIICDDKLFALFNMRNIAQSKIKDEILKILDPLPSVPSPIPVDENCPPCKEEVFVCIGSELSALFPDINPERTSFRELCQYLIQYLKREGLVLKDSPNIFVSNYVVEQLFGLEAGMNHNIFTLTEILKQHIRR